MFSFIEKYKILYDYQFGFRIKHSTHMALSLFIDKLTHYIENGEHSIGVYLDFSKAFDTIDHDILYMKLHHYGFRSHVLDWIKSYMSNRCQYVSYNGHDSMMQDISCGVPQGSILGPLLFLLYINDLGNICQNLSAFMFADDTSLLGHDTDISVLKAKVNADLMIISSWLNANKLSLNLSKSHFMLFTRKHFNLTDINITVNNVCINRVNKVKFLGTIMDDKLNWQEHITYICKKASKCIGILYKLRQYVDVNTAKLLYYTLVYPYLTYCNIVWGNTFKQYLRPLMVIQKKAVRIIVGNRIFLEHTDPLFSKTKIIKFNLLYGFSVSQFMYSFYHGELPAVFDTMFIYNSTVHNYNTRQTGNLHIPKVKSNLGKRCLRYSGSIIWNDVVNKINVNCSIYSFKSRLKHILI
jgi:hypothetical protein